MGDVKQIIKGIREAQHSLDAITARTDAATLKAMLSAQRAAKTSVKSGMRGRPRWDHRGAIGRGKTVPAVSLNLNPHHVEKSGGPGMLTGSLYRAVGVVKRPKKIGNEYKGGIGCGGPKSITNQYRLETNGRYPFVQPGVDRAKVKIRTAFETAWAKATET
jgi:hypothetical protein